MPDSQSDLPPRKQDAIHRALLSGLLGNVGARHDKNEYSGIRGKKFHLFPGSSLFRHRPPWVMSAELVETTRLYARTVASVSPHWIERAAAHMVKREILDPHWRPDLGRVMAYEKVTLHGLTLVPRRQIHFGPIDPLLAREIFIHHALILGEYDSDAPFFLHNLRLVKEIELLEAKARRRDVLVETKARFAFYDARVPKRIYTADEFERWRHLAEKQNPQLLFMSRQDLMLHPAMGVTEDLYPDSLTVANPQRPLTQTSPGAPGEGEGAFPLEYRFELGDRADGITVTIPLAALNQLSSEPFDWLVPGFRFDLFVGLIRTLPKALRVKFVPIPDVARRAAEQLTPAHGKLLDALAHFLGKISGEPISANEFQPQVLPEYLRMNFRVVDASGTQIATGRDLGMIRRRLGIAARKSFATAPPPGYQRDELIRWEFDDLPRHVEIHHSGMTFSGYPALVDAGSSVSLRLFDQPDIAAESIHGGLRRLFMLQLHNELQHIEQTIPDIDRLCLFYSTIGRCDDLRDDLLEAIADRAFFADEPLKEIRTRDAFAMQAEAGWRRLSSSAAEVTNIVAASLETYHALNLALSAEFPPLWADSIRDLQDQLAHLVYRGFVARTPFAHLVSLPRFLRGMGLRLQKIGNAGLTRDELAMREVVPLWEQYKQAAARHREQGIHDSVLDEIRWMIEELRISLFAQELKAAVPVSGSRLMKMWEQVGK